MEQLIEQNYIHADTYFCEDAFSLPENREKAREKWNAILSQYRERKAKWEEDYKLQKEVKNEFSEWMKRRKLNISRACCASVDKSIEKAYPYMHYSTPRLYAWIKRKNGELIKIIPSYDFDSFDVAYDACEKHLVWLVSNEKTRNEKMKQAIEYCISNNLEWKIDTAINVATNHQAQKLLEEATGKVFDIDFCDTCSTWTEGDHRCSCGNRRVDLTWDGEFPNVYVYPEPY